MESSSVSPSSKHDVFLSFRGIDTRDNIISHLLKYLKDKNILAFLDTEIRVGEEISEELIIAIKESKVSIVIFSENYANSKWCLNELVVILECKTKQNQKVIPVFYKVDPRDVRNQTREFGEAFENLLDSYKNGSSAASISIKEQMWRDALKEIGRLKGREYSNMESEADFIDTIADDALDLLNNASYRNCGVEGYIGINSRIEKIMALLDIESTEIRMVGIWGMGGIGKTTVARAVFNKISCKFESCCFLGDVREKAKNGGLDSMRDSLISQLLNNKKMEKQEPHIGDAFTKHRLSRRRVLVVLDDVDDYSLQLEFLIGGRGTGKDRFGKGSRVIVTTRNKQVLAAHDITDVYNMESLHDDEALKLLFHHALRPKQPANPYPDISNKMVEYTKGVPLALRVLGLSLRGRSQPEDWEGALKKLKEAPSPEVSDVLKISYDGLEIEEKDLFLDIACFFKGTSFDTVKNVLGGCYTSLHSGISVLVDKSLITINHRNISICNMTAKGSCDSVEMHELVQKMGWNVVTGESEKPGSRSRLWRTKDVCDVLTENTGTDKIKSILLDVSDVNAMNLDPQGFEKMLKLNFLKIMKADSSVAFDSSKISFTSDIISFPKRLKYFYWHKYPSNLDGLPSFNELIEVYISLGKFERLWTGVQNLEKLKILRLHFCYEMIEIPDLSLAKNLEEMDLTGCCRLKNISSSIQHFDKFTHLNLKLCAHLTEISSFIQCLKNLTHLNLSWCTCLKEISTFIEHLNHLTYLNLKECKNLTEIPSSIEHLNNLTHLNIGGCKNLTEIPSSIGNLKNLLFLNLTDCKSLTKIPSSITHLNNLIYLNLQFCISLAEIPLSIEYPNSVIHLKLRDCIKITNFPHLSNNIKILEVDGILIEKNLRSLALLTNLVKLVLWSCTDYQKSPEFLQEMKSVAPSGCKIFRDVSRMIRGCEKTEMYDLFES